MIDSGMEARPRYRAHLGNRCKLGEVWEGMGGGDIGDGGEVDVQVRYCEVGIGTWRRCLVEATGLWTVASDAKRPWQGQTRRKRIPEELGKGEEKTHST